MRTRSMLLFLLALLLPSLCLSQTVPVVLLSDLHFDPLRDPGKGPQLAKAPIADWPAILRAPATSTQAADFAVIQARCGTRTGTDTGYALLTSALRAASMQGTGVRFVTVSGDLVVHQFECRWKAATGSDKGYEDFHEKTANFVIRQVEAAFPNTAVYLALGNNDTSCGDYRMDLHDRYLAATSDAVVDGLVGGSERERAQVQVDYRTGGYFAVALPGLVKTRLLVLDDLFLSRKYKTCTGKDDKTEAATVLHWLGHQLDQARQHGEAVWFLAHIPPGIDVYNTFAKFRDVCNGDAPEQFLADDALGTLLAAHADTVRLALFGHTHSDEVRLIGGVPAKLIGAVTPVNGNLPTITLGQADRTSSRLTNYTVYMASSRDGTGPWTPEYNYRKAYSAEAFTAAALRLEIDGFLKDPGSATAASKNYEQGFYPGSPSPLVLVWSQAACAMGNYTAASYRSCVCKQ